MKLYKKVLIIISVLLLFLSGCGNATETLEEDKQGETKFEKEIRKISPYVEMVNKGVFVMETDVSVKYNEVLYDSIDTRVVDTTIKYIDDGKIVVFTLPNQNFDITFSLWFVYVNDTFYSFLLNKNTSTFEGLIPSSNFTGYYKSSGMGVDPGVNISTLYSFHRSYLLDPEMEYLESGEVSIDGFDYTYEEYLFQDDNIRFFFDDNNELVKYNVSLANGEKIKDTGMTIRKPTQTESELLSFVYQKINEKGIQIS